MRHIHRLVVDEQEEHEDWLGAVGFANGIVRADVDVVGWEDIKF